MRRATDLEFVVLGLIIACVAAYVLVEVFT
jgi:hypothetical protein